MSIPGISISTLSLLFDRPSLKKLSAWPPAAVTASAPPFKMSVGTLCFIVTRSKDKWAPREPCLFFPQRIGKRRFRTTRYLQTFKKTISIYFVLHKLKNPTADPIIDAEHPVGSLRFWRRILRNTLLCLNKLIIESIYPTLDSSDSGKAGTAPSRRTWISRHQLISDRRIPASICLLGSSNFRPLTGRP